MMRLRCHIVEVLPHLGGQCRTLYPEKPIYDIPGFTRITGQELTDKLVAQMTPFQPTVHLEEEGEALLATPTGWQLKTTKQRTLHAKAILVAGGAGAFAPHKPPLEDLTHFEDKSLFYTVTSQKELSGKHIIIAGGGDSAVDWAIELADKAASITLVHRRATFRAAPESLERLQRCVKTKNVSLATPFSLHKLEGHKDTGRLTHVHIASLDNQAVRRLPADVLLPFFGLKSALGAITTWGLTIDRNHIVIDPTTAATNRPGIFAIGDIATYPHKRKLIATGFAEAFQAASAIRRHIYPGEAQKLGHSTSTGLPSLGNG
jgi:thioredoxin reductase (NADPH)